MAGHSRLKDGVASARLCPAIHVLDAPRNERRGCPDQAWSSLVKEFACVDISSRNLETQLHLANTTSRSRGLIRPSFARNFLALQTEGAGNAGCALHPRSRVQMHE